MGYVWTMEGLEPLEKWLLIVLSDYADDEGDSIFPALDTMMKRSALSRASVQRLLKRLVAKQRLEHLVSSTPLSPSFYRIVGIPRIPVARGPDRENRCPATLRNAVIYAFGACCEYCKRAGSVEFDPDRKGWCVDRVIPGYEGGRYVPDNVTLACGRCNSGKKNNPAPAGTRSLSHLRPGGDFQQRPRGITERPPLRGEGEVSDGNLPGSQPVGEGGIPGIPDPLSDPSSDPKEQAAPSSPHLLEPVENEEINYALLVKVTHEVLDDHAEHGQARSVNQADVERDVEALCIRRRIPWTREHVRRAFTAAWAARRQGNQRGARS